MQAPLPKTHIGDSCKTGQLAHKLVEEVPRHVNWFALKDLMVRSVKELRFKQGSATLSHVCLWNPKRQIPESIL